MSESEIKPSALSAKETERDTLNLRHAAFPVPGDYWHEMFCPVRVVLSVHVDAVIFCEKTKSVDTDHWTWDLSQTQAASRADFSKRLTYGGIGSRPDSLMANKFWCDVAPRAHADVAKAYRDLIGVSER